MSERLLSVAMPARELEEIGMVAALCHSAGPKRSFPMRYIFLINQTAFVSRSLNYIFPQKPAALRIFCLNVVFSLTA